jgi:diadenosine tetraphosphate (Ap4A) HIT family hydrolase
MMSGLRSCPFCTIDPARVWIENEHAIAFAPADPITDGHLAIAPRKHIATVYALATDEQAALWQLAGRVRDRLLIGLKPDSFDIGFSEGETEHDHIHVVPRHRGDGLVPRVGVRWLAADHALYRSR